MIFPTPSPPPRIEIEPGVFVDTIHATVAQWRAAKLHYSALDEDYRDSIDGWVKFADEHRFSPNAILVEEVKALIQNKS